MTLADIRKSAAGRLTRPLVQLLARTGITPNMVTWAGFWLTVAAAVLIGVGDFFSAGIVVLVAGFFDMLDGALARSTNQTSRFGGILDSTLDRLSEAVLLLAILIFYVLNISERTVVVVLLASASLTGSFLVSYVRARMEGAGLECGVGFFTRAERVIVLALGLLLGQVSYFLIVALAIIAFFSFVTTGQRLTEAWRQTRIR